MYGECIKLIWEMSFCDQQLKSGHMFHTQFHHSIHTSEINHLHASSLWLIYFYCSTTGLRGCVHRAEEDRPYNFGVCWSGFHLHLHPGDVIEMGRLWICQVLHQCLVLAGLLHCGCKPILVFFFYVRGWKVFNDWSSITPWSDSKTWTQLQNILFIRIFKITTSVIYIQYTQGRAYYIYL